MSGGDHLDMGRLSLNESQHAGPQPNSGGGGGFERTAYIPPHLRSRGGPAPGPGAGPAPGIGAEPGMMNGGGAAAGMNSSQWGNQGG
jgi:ATP-dependent RNA helicase DDX3X